MPPCFPPSTVAWVWLGQRSDGKCRTGKWRTTRKRHDVKVLLVSLHLKVSAVLFQVVFTQKTSSWWLVKQYNHYPKLLTCVHTAHLILSHPNWTELNSTPAKPCPVSLQFRWDEMRWDQLVRSERSLITKRRLLTEKKLLISVTVIVVYWQYCM